MVTAARTALFVVLCVVSVSLCDCSEVYTDPHRLLADKLEKLRVTAAAAATAPPTPATPHATHAIDESPLPEYEITNTGISQVKTVVPSLHNLNPNAMFYHSVEDLVLVSIAERIGADTDTNGLADATDGLSTGAVGDADADVKAEAETEADTNSAANTAGDTSAANTASNTTSTAASTTASATAATPGAKRKGKSSRGKAKGSLSCACTFVPLPNALPPPSPTQQKRNAAKEEGRNNALLSKIKTTANGKGKANTNGKTNANATPAALSTATTATTTASTAPTTSTTTSAPTSASAPASAPAPASSGSTPGASAAITPLKLLETKAAVAEARPHFDPDLRPA